MTLSDDLLVLLLERALVARLATVGGDGAPHIVPVVFCAWQGAVLVPVDGKRKRGTPLKRFANVAVEPRVSLLIDDYAQDWRALWWVRIDGTGTRFQPPRDAGAAIEGVLRAKYPQYEALGVGVDSTTWLRVEIGRVSAWAQSGDLGTIRAALERGRAG